MRRRRISTQPSILIGDGFTEEETAFLNRVNQETISRMINARTIMELDAVYNFGRERINQEMERRSALLRKELKENKDLIKHAKLVKDLAKGATLTSATKVEKEILKKALSPIAKEYVDRLLLGNEDVDVWLDDPNVATRIPITYYPLKREYDEYTRTLERLYERIRTDKQNEILKERRIADLQEMLRRDREEAEEGEATQQYQDYLNYNF